MLLPDRCALSPRLYRGGAKCFGPGICRLLHLVESTGSLRAAALEMGMAYSKAWRIMREVESALDAPLLASTTGGPHGGGAVLTPAAREMLRRYDAFMAEVAAGAEQAFRRHFGGPVGE